MVSRCPLEQALGDCQEMRSVSCLVTSSSICPSRREKSLAIAFRHCPCCFCLKRRSGCECIVGDSLRTEPGEP